MGFLLYLPACLPACLPATGQSRDHSVADGLDYVATWNAAALQSEDLKVAAAAASAAAKKRSNQQSGGHGGGKDNGKKSQMVPPVFSKL